MDRICGHGESLVRGRYLILNNLWGAAGGSGSQCLWSPVAAGGERGDQVAGETAIAWGTSWDWAGPANAVKSYAAAILGWHWGWPGPESGLPVRLGDIAEARSRWDFRLDKTAPGPQNVAYDIWLASAEDPRMEDLTDEIMIWLHRDGDATPIGSRVATVAIGGVVWELWQGPHPGRGWRVHSFVRSANTDSVSLDLGQFLDFLISYGLSKSAWLVGIEAGTEVFSGAGTLETACYEIDIRRV
jgi:hypothetical protein